MKSLKVISIGFLLVSITSVFAGVNTGGGGGTLPELERILDSSELNQFRDGIRDNHIIISDQEMTEVIPVVREDRSSASYYRFGLMRGRKFQTPIYLDIQNISEFTLKDGTVIRTEELLENVQNN